MTPLLFLPGAGGRSSFWAPVAARLSDLGPAHRLAWPGFGDCPADPAIRSTDDLFAWMRSRLPAGRSHVVAQSMGGVLAARLAIEHPERVDRLVLVATSGGVDVAQAGGVDWRPEYEESLPDVPRWFVEDRTDLAGRLGEIRAPTLLLWGDADPVSPVAVGRLLEARIPGARLEVVRGGSHAFASERPDEVAALVRAHLASGGARGLAPMTEARTRAWLFLSVPEEPVPLEDVIAAADGINHAIPTDRELQVSLGWLQAQGLVRKADRRYSLTAAGVALRTACSARSVAKTWELVAARLAAAAHHAAPEDDVSSAEIAEAYARYRKRARSIFEKRRR